MHIGLLGGAFNPPHIGHILVAQQVLDFAGLDEVWFLPNYQQSPPKPVASVENRLAMTRLLSCPRTIVSTLEIDHQLDGQTIHLLPYLPKEHEYMFIIGSDQLSSFHLWGEYKTLVSKLPFLVFPRYGYPNEPLYPNMTVVNDPTIVSFNISSTKIRDRIARGLSIANFVPKEVDQYIQTHKLYTMNN